MVQNLAKFSQIFVISTSPGLTKDVFSGSMASPSRNEYRTFRATDPRY